MGQFYSLTVRWNNGNTTEFRDSAKKFPNMSVRKIAVSFKLDVTKGDIDYDAPRPVGYTMTPEEADYLIRDVLIVAKAVGQTLANGMSKLTIGSDALNEYKDMIGKRQFERLYPIFPVKMDADIRRAYRGGFTYADPRFKGKLNGAGLVLDVNSLYPFVMRTKLLPYGEPEYVKGQVLPTATKPLTIQHITFTAKIRKNHIPCIQIKGSLSFLETEYLTEVNEPTVMSVTNVDMQLMLDHYHVNILEYAGGWRFNAAEGLFDSYIDKWMLVKANSTGGIREIAKLHLNSLYGKFATNPIVASKNPVLEGDTVKLTRGEDSERKPIYSPMGIFITSYARELTIRAAQENYSVFAYADTDSLHLMTTTIPKTLEVHESNIGAWKLEYRFKNAYYVRAKAYFELKENGAYHNAVAGLPVELANLVRFDDLRPGMEVWQEGKGEDAITRRAYTGSTSGVLIRGKLVPQSVPGGIVLKDTPYQLKL